MTFETLGLHKPLMRAVRASAYTEPTLIQAQAIPAILAGRDVMAAAQTGTGKTAGFTLPLLQQLSETGLAQSKRIRALVLTPTRELAAQVQASVMTYGKYLDLRSTTAYGGVNIRPQKEKLRKGVDILVATPGRLLDLSRQKAVRFDAVEVLVLDEADRMLDMGFIDDIKKIIGMMPKDRQNLMFSATFSEQIRQLAKTLTRQPVEIDVAPRNSTVETITQKVHPVDKSRKAELLSHLIREENLHQVLVFSRTKHGADKLVKRLARDNINAAAIHGDKSQAQRMRALDRFKRNKSQVLVATDIASRGIDIEQLSQVVNFDLPTAAEDYIHRIGRTGRAGASGTAISLVSADEVKHLLGIERLIKKKIDREEVEDFEPEHRLPESASGKSGRNHKPRSNNKNRRRGSRAHGNDSNDKPFRGRKPKPKTVAKKNKSGGGNNHASRSRTASLEAAL